MRPTGRARYAARCAGNDSGRKDEHGRKPIRTPANQRAGSDLGKRGVRQMQTGQGIERQEVKVVFSEDSGGRYYFESWADAISFAKTIRKDHLQAVIIITPIGVKK